MAKIVLTRIIYFYRADKTLKSSAVFSVKENEMLLDALADALYIEEELVPFHANWRAELVRDNETIFTYLGEEFVRVTYHGELGVHVYDL